MIINTELKQIYVEIEGEEYPLAERTIATEEKLDAAFKNLVGQPVYRAWLAELEVLLGKSATKKLFPNGKNENLDRLYMIRTGVASAYEQNRMTADAIASERRAEAVDLSSITGPVDKLNRLFEHVEKVQKPVDGPKMIHRG